MASREVQMMKRSAEHYVIMTLNHSKPKVLSVKIKNAEATASDDTLLCVFKVHRKWYIASADGKINNISLATEA